MAKICFSILFCICLVSQTSAKVILIPQEAQTVKEAVEMAASGDEIVLSASAEWVKETSPNEETFVIQNKNLRIRATDNSANPILIYHPKTFTFRSNCDTEPRCSSVWIENSHISFEGLSISTRRNYVTGTGNGVQSTPISTTGGSLSFLNCEIYGQIVARGSVSLEGSQFYVDTTLTGTAGPYPHTRSSIEAGLRIQSTENVVIDINHSLIDCVRFNSYLPLELRDIQAGIVNIHNSNIRGGTFAYFSRSSNNAYWESIAGGYGMKVSSCKDVSLNFSESIVLGGVGYNKSSDAFLRALPAGKGGAGLWIENSIVDILGGTFVGGMGGNGYLIQSENFSRFRISGDGGAGLKVNSSKVHNVNIEAKGGEGGMGEEQSLNLVSPGDKGADIEIDNQSTFQVENTQAKIGDWGGQ